MADFPLEYLIGGVIGLGIMVTLAFIFGIEIPFYFALGGIGLFLYIYSKNPAVSFASGWVGRISTILFFISLFYYIGTKTFFPPSPFEFRFLFVAFDYVNEFKSELGGLILSLVH